MAGSVKARGGIYEVLKHAEDLAIAAGKLNVTDNYEKLCSDEMRAFFNQYTVQVGSTGNLGTWAGKLYYAFVGLVLVVCLAIGPIFGIVDSIPVRLELSGSAPVCLVASHGQSEKYRLDTDTITDVQLRDTLPDAARTWGTGMDHYLQGDFYVIGEGNARFCLDPTQKCFLRVEAGGQVYWFTGDSEDHTAAIAQALQSAVHP